MEHFRENILTRGTADCPFAQYHLQAADADVILAPTHWHPEGEILYIRQGLVELRCAEELLTLSPGQIAFIPTGALHTVRTVLPRSSYEAFVFSFELLKLPPTHFFQRELITPLRTGTHRLPSVLMPGDPPYSAVAAALDAICGTAPESADRKPVIFSSMVQLLTAMKDSLQLCPASPFHTGNEAVKQCLNYMQAHYAQHITLQKIAQAAHLHPNYLCALFKSCTGQTVFQHLNRIRTEKAAELLRLQKGSVAEVAAACGFDNSGYFAKKFKEIIGCSPKQYSLGSR